MSTPFSAYEWLLAGRYLGARRRRDAISVIAGFSLAGVAIGVATLIVVMAVMNGLRSDLLAHLLGLSGHAIVQAETPGEGMGDYRALADKLLAVPGVVSAAPIIRAQVMLTHDRAGSGAQLTAIAPEDLRRLPAFAGAAASFQGDGLILGRRLAMRLDVHIGDKIKVLSLRENTAKGAGVVPHVGIFTVGAIVALSEPSVESGAAYLPLAAAQSYFGQPGMVTAIEMMVQNPEAIDTLKPALIAAAGPQHEVVTWRDDNAARVSAIGVERNVTFLILTLAIVVAAFNTVSGLVMLVKDKGHEIGILRSMGATSGAVMRIFFIAGAAIGVTGTVLGFAVGVGFCLEIEHVRGFLTWAAGSARFIPEVNFLLTLPVRMESEDVVAVIVMALFLSFAATIYPAWRASRLDPIKALRYE